MGGKVFVGIRRSTGEEHLVEAWTNSMPLWLCDPDFFMESKGVDEFLKLAKRTHKWPDAALVDEIQPSEYGVILVDFKNKKLFSRQDYCVPSYLFCNSPLVEDELDILNKLLSLNLLDRATHIHAPLFPQEAEVALSPHLIERLHNGDGYFRLVRLYPKFPFTIDHHIVSASECWPEVMAWVKGNGWQSPIWDEARIHAEMSDLESQ